MGHTCPMGTELSGRPQTLMLHSSLLATHAETDLHGAELDKCASHRNYTQIPERFIKDKENYLLPSLSPKSQNRNTTPADPINL